MVHQWRSLAYWKLTEKQINFFNEIYYLIFIWKYICLSKYFKKILVQLFLTDTVAKNWRILLLRNILSNFCEKKNLHFLRRGRGEDEEDASLKNGIFLYVLPISKEKNLVAGRGCHRIAIAYVSFLGVVQCS